MGGTPYKGYGTVINSVTDYICHCRQSTIGRLLTLCHTLIDRYTSSRRVCQVEEPCASRGQGDNAELSRECDALVLGCLIKELSEAQLWPIPEPADVDISVSGLGAILLDLSCYHKSVNGRENHPAHEKCVFTAGLRKDVQQVLNTLLTGITGTDRQHLQVQAQKAGQQAAQA